MGLVYYAEWMKRQSNRRATPLVGPGAAAVDEFKRRGWVEGMTDGQRLALLIAVGIGVHNFGEGLAIGQAAANGRREPRGDADRRLLAPQRDRGLRHLRPDERRGHAADAGASSRCSA